MENTVTKKKQRRYFDYFLLFTVLLLVGFGLLMIYSTSSYSASLEHDGNSLYYFKKQAQAVGIGLVLMSFVSFIPSGFYKKLAPFAYIGSIIFILLILTKLGYSSHGARRWIKLFGFSIQPAEIAKLGIIIFTAFLIEKMSKKERKSWKGIFLALFHAGLISVMLLVITNNFSSAFIVGGIAFMMLALSEDKNIRAYSLLIFAAIVAVAIVIFIATNKGGNLSNFRSQRIVAWLNPEASADDKGFQTLQALYGIGSGGVWGKGLGKSMQKLGFLPEAHNDMIFSVICEELGLFGGFSVIILFILLLWRIRDIATHIDDTFENLILTGIFSHIAIQVIMNVGVVTNTIPNTGISLPFISYGGSSVMFLLIEMGIVMSIGRDCDFVKKVPVKKKKRVAEDEEK